MKKNDDRLDLTALRSEVPLRDADYAAIRARVRAELAERRMRSWFPLWLRFAVTAVVIAAVAALLVVPRNDPPAIVAEPALPITDTVPAPPPRMAEVTTAPPVPIPAPAEERQFGTADVRKPAVPVASRRAVEQAASNPIEIATTEPMRIEMHTEDPDVRIIWIVQPLAETKENS